MSGFVESVFFISIVLFIFCAIMVYLFLKPQPYSLRIIEKNYQMEKFLMKLIDTVIASGFSR